MAENTKLSTGGLLERSDLSHLERLPIDVLRAILSQLHTAQSIARLSRASRKLHSDVTAHGWVVFVRSHFGSLALPIRPESDDRVWAKLAKRLVWQSRGWDRRAFSLASWVKTSTLSTEDDALNALGVGRGGRGGRGRGGGGRGRGRNGGKLRNQTFPPHVVVDAKSFDLGGDSEVELVAFGHGEDVVIRWRETTRSTLHNEQWRSLEGAAAGYRSGADDVSAIAILPSDGPYETSILVGRASGDLSLRSIRPDDFGRIKASLRPPASAKSQLEQNEIHHFDVESSTGRVAAVTKQSILYYQLPEPRSKLPTSKGKNAAPVVEATSGYNIADILGSTDFRHLRQAKFMKNGDLAFCMTWSEAPVRFLTHTPSGPVLSNAAKLRAGVRCPETLIYGGANPQNARALLPVDVSSISGGSGHTILSSYDDGTVRLQDLRTSSAFDTIYQDHFEVETPIGPLVSYGMERFIAGSARAPVLKIFDYRWTKPYSYTDALPCREVPMVQKPKSLTLQAPPPFPGRGKCDYLRGLSCNLHTLARTDFLRPSFSVYLTVSQSRQASTPVYSLAKSSDLSTIVYAGTIGELTRISLIDRQAQLTEGNCMARLGKQQRCGYDYRETLTSLVETGDGLALSDISKSSRLPALFKQKPNYGNDRRPWQRLDESLV